MFKLKKEANLKRNYFITSSRLKWLHLIIIVFSIFSLLGLIVSIRAPAFIQILCIVFGILAIYKINNKLKGFRYELDFDLIIRESLLFVLYTNHLYTSEKDNSGYEKIIRSAILKYELDNQNGRIIIKALIRGDEFSKKVQTLDDVLAGVLELELEEKITHPNIVEYHFYYKKPDRLILSPHNHKKEIDSLDIDLGYDITYNPIKCPHILVSGGTGSGKSIFISFLIIELLKRNSTLYIADPKNSDLGSLSHYLSDKTDKKSKEVIAEVMDGIKQIILLGRQAGVFILISAQQMRAETLNTDLRDNLGLRIALGANSIEGYRMVFGTATPDKFKSIEEKGAGYLYMQGSGKEKAQYWESPYLDTTQFDFIKELQLYVTKSK